MNFAIYEHPLNEKFRNFLRIEYLFNQIDSCGNLEKITDYLPFFDSLFALAELLDRNDLRADLGKELEKQEQQLVQWANHPQVCSDALQATLRRVVNLQTDINKSTRDIADLRDDAFLSSVRQRISISGGSCPFDLPHLHHWLAQPVNIKETLLNKWLSPLQRFKEAVTLILTFLREQNPFQEQTAIKGMYQESAEGVNLLRIKAPLDAQAYPTVSGNKYRFNIRFMAFDMQNARVGYESDIAFYLSCC